MLLDKFFNLNKTTMSAFEPRDWDTLDMNTKIRLFSLHFPPHRVLRTLRAGQGLSQAPFLPRLYTEDESESEDEPFDLPPPPAPQLVRHDPSIGGWVAERHVTFQDQEFPAHVRQMLRELRCSPPPTE
jgi:hypothetical protein